MSQEHNDQGQPAEVANTTTVAPESNNAPAAETVAPEAAPEKVYAGKYKTVDDLEKGYKETSKYAREQAALAKEYQGKIPTAPEKYTFDFTGVAGLEDATIDESSPDIAGMLPVFKELNLTQDQVSKLVSAHMLNTAAMVQTPEQIKEKLGANADVIVNKLQAFTSKLPIEDQRTVQALADTAEGVDFLYRHLIGQELGVPAQAGVSGSTAKSAADLKAEAFKYKNDNINSIGFDQSKQAQYDKLMRTALMVEEAENKNKK